MSKRTVLKKVISCLFIILVLAACAPTPDPAETSAGTPAAVQEAQTWLAEQLKISGEEIKIVSFEQVEWSDSCFGLGGAAETCAAVVTPGWLANFEVSGQPYEVRFGETGTIARSPQI